PPVLSRLGTPHHGTPAPPAHPRHRHTCTTGTPAPQHYTPRAQGTTARRTESAPRHRTTARRPTARHNATPHKAPPHKAPPPKHHRHHPAPPNCRTAHGRTARRRTAAPFHHRTPPVPQPCPDNVGPTAP